MYKSLRKMKKSLASLLSITLAVSLFLSMSPAAAASELAPAGVTAAASKSVSMPLTNPGFEDSAPGAAIPGWSSMFAVKEGEYTYAVSTENSHSGNQSLKITDTSQSNSVALMSGKLDITSGVTYTVTASVYMEESGTASLNLRYFDAADKSIAEKPLHNDTSKGFPVKQWTSASTSLEAPANAAYARIILYTTAYSRATAYYDDITMSYEQPVQLPGKLALSAPASAEQGDTISTMLSLTEGADISSVTASIYYDPSMLEIAEVKPAGAFGDAQASFSSDKENGSIRLEGSLPDAIDGDSDIAKMTFNVIADSGSTWLMLAKGAQLNGMESVSENVVKLITIGEASGQPGASLDDIQFGEPEFKTLPISGVVGLMDGEAGIEDGKNVMYTTVKGIPPMFHVVDLDDYRVIRSLPLEGGGEVWNHEIAPDGTVYITSAGQLWAYSPVTKDVKKVYTHPTESVFWCLAIDEAGAVYIGAGPGGRVLKYDPATKESRDYGIMVDGAGQQYVRSIDYSNGYIYAGTSHSKVYKVNVETGGKVEIASSLNETGYVYDLSIVDDKFLVIRYDTPQKRYIYDIEAGEWLDVVIEKSSSGLHLPKKSLNGKIYFPADKKIKTFDIVTHEVADSGMEYETAFRGANWVQVDDPDLPGTSLVTMNFSGIIVFFNPQTNTVKRYENILPPSATITHKFVNGPDGKIYVTGMQASKAAAYDIATNTAKTFSMGQAGAVESYGNRMYFGVYPGGDIYEYDLGQPDGTGNPKKLFTLGNGQDRIGASTLAGDKIYFGSVSTYGELGGAITVFDPTAADPSAAYRVFRNVVQDQSVVSLAYKDRKLYGSTSINGGMAVDPKASEAKLFVWDTVKEEKILEMTLDIPGLSNPPAIGGLTFGPDGLLWGGVNGYVFALEPNTLQVIKYFNVNPADSGTALRWGNYDLVWSKEGILLANLTKKLYAIDPATFEFIELADTESFTLGPDGHLYYAPSFNRTQMYRITMNMAKEPEVPGNDRIRFDLAAPAETKTGETFDVTVKAADADLLYSMHSRISYDASKLELVDVAQAGQFAGEGTYMNTTLVPGKAVITSSLTGDRSVIGDTDVFTLSFKALNLIGNASVTLAAGSSWTLANADETGELHHISEDIVKHVSIVKAVAEDVNHDGTVDLLDVMLVAKFVGTAVNEDTRELDINGDGLIDIADLGLVVLKLHSAV